MNTDGRPSPLIGALMAGPLDVIGDVHGEIGPLRELLQRLGYDGCGEHPQRRRLVFVGDIGDRGPDSPAVAEWIMSLVAQGRAQCVLGNHELNLLRGEPKVGNAWFMDPRRGEQQPGGAFAHSKAAAADFKPRYLAFLSSLPLALERPDLRIAHAAWVPAEIERLRQARGPVIDVFARYEATMASLLREEGLTERAARENTLHQAELSRPGGRVPLLRAMGEYGERNQMGNPVRIVTSGVERLAGRPFWSNQKWRMCARMAWWDDYVQDIPVIVGHYWRRLKAPLPQDRAEPDLFADIGPTQWMGPRANVFCVDYSIGARHEERRARRTVAVTRLAAMRWPERELVFNESSDATPPPSLQAD